MRERMVMEDRKSELEPWLAAANALLRSMEIASTSNPKECLAFLILQTVSSNI